MPQETIPRDQVKFILDLIRSYADRQLQLIDQVRGEHKREVTTRMKGIKDLCKIEDWK